VNGPPAPERLDKILSNNGFGSRADVRKLIRSGAVTCDGAAARDPERKLRAETARITVSGVELKYKKFIYLMMNKPAGVISASYDPKRRTVADLLCEPYKSRNPFPAGRLDADATGLILMTDDGGLAHSLLSPKKHVEKEYVVCLDKIPGAAVADSFTRGAVLDGNIRLRPAELLLSGAAEARVVLTEGKFHQIKRMFLAYGIRVTGLERVRMGPLVLDPLLAQGESRELTPSELSSIKKECSC
jgi:16S rRNA pseudouridine516 synthase